MTSERQRRITDLNISELISQLRQTTNKFGDEFIRKKKKLLSEIAARRIYKMKLLVEYHDCLLFLLAYPDNKELINLANEELIRIASITREFFTGKNERNRIQLTGTGLAYTQVNVTFSFVTAEWLANKYPAQVKIFECAADVETINSVFSLFLPKAELGFLEKKQLSLENLIRSLKGKSNLTDLQYLLNLIRQKNLPVEVRDHLYDSLKIYVSWLLDGQVPSKTFARSLPGKIFYHKIGLQKVIEAKKLIESRIDKPLKISPGEKKQLVETSRGILCMMLRETDPVTFADEHAVELFDMGRGVDIALYPMVGERRLPFACYIGYTAFKNRLPVAYGGGWIFQHRSKIGVNVFEQYRGGESSYIFCQVLRLYHHHYRVNRFIVEPYQIGKKNMEGLKSGAFWFYYRLGFRPVRDELISLAGIEFQKIESDKSYRSSLNTMKKLADSNMELILNEVGDQQIDPLLLNKSITSMIKERFAGDRQKAENECLKQVKKILSIKDISSWLPVALQSLQNFSLLMKTFSDFSSWTDADKQKMVELIRLKGAGSEHQYIREFQKYKKLNNSLARL